MNTFTLPKALAIVNDGFGVLDAFEHDPLDPLQKDDPVIAVMYADGAFACSTEAEWVASIKHQAIAAYKRGDSSITVA